MQHKLMLKWKGCDCEGSCICYNKQLIPNVHYPLKISI